MKTKRTFRFLIPLSLVLAILASMAISAEDPVINAGVAWLGDQATQDGSLGKVVDLPGSGMAILGLSASGEDVTKAIKILGDAEPLNVVDAVFRLLAVKNPALADDLDPFRESDGSFGSVHMTALAALALAAAGASDPGTISYLKDIQNDDGSFGPDKDLVDTAIAALALKASGQPDPAALDYLLRSQHPGGSFGDTAANAWAVLCLSAYGGHPVELNAAVNHLNGLRNDDSGWSLDIDKIESRFRKHKSDLYVTGLCAWALSGAGVDVSAATGFLKAEHDLSGIWKDDSRAIKVTGTVVDVLRHIQEKRGVQAAGMAFLTTADAANYDQEARRLATLIGGEADVSDAFEIFLSHQISKTGEWPFAPGYGGDALITALALEAMTRAHFYDGTIQNRAVSYLRDNVNSDGSWGYGAGSDGTVAATAEIMLALDSYRRRFDLDQLLENAGGWIEDQQNADGSFGPDGGSAAETALALLALYSTDFTGEVVTGGYDKLLSLQESDGSWEHDPYATALALWAIYDAKPNLFLRDQDVTFSDDNPTEGDEITVRAMVTNKGGFPAEQVLVRFYNGDPKKGGVPIGEDTIGDLARKEQATAEITWTVIDLTGTKYVFAVADPEDRVEESNEADNQGVHDLLISSKPDLVITDADISTLPETPDLSWDTAIQIFAKVRNAGDRDAENFQVELSSVDPDSGGPASLIDWTVSIPAGGEVELSGTFMPFGGTNNYTVVLDTLDQIAESDEGNNSATISLELSDRVDLSLTNLLYSDQNPAEGELVTITAVVYNTFFHDVSNVEVRFWLGNPQEGGTVLADGVITGTILPGKTGRVEAVFDTEGHAGANYIYAKVDPDNEIVEANEYNNQSKGALHVTSKPDLLLIGEDILFNARVGLFHDYDLEIDRLMITRYAPHNFSIQGDDLRIQLLLSNRGFTSAEDVLVRFFLGNPYEGGVMLDLDQVVPEVAYRSGPRGGAWGSATTSQYTSVVTVHYNTMGMALGVYDLWVALDPMDTVPELDEGNNWAHSIFLVIGPPDLLISESRISFDPVHPEEGDTAIIQAVVKNDGISPCKDFIVRFYDGDPRISGELIDEQIVPLIDPVLKPWALGGHSTQISGKLPMEVTVTSTRGYDTEGKLGFRDIFVQVDAEDNIAESDEENNLAYRRLQVVPASAPDLTIRSESITFDPESAASGSTIMVSATVENLRHHTARNVEVRFYRYDPNVGTVEIGSGGTVSELAGRESATVSTEFDTTGVVGRVVVSAFADPADEIPETDETNNRGERPVVIKLPPEYLPAGLKVDVRWTTAFLSWVRSQFAGVGHYVLRDGEIVNADLMDVAKGAVISASDFRGDHVADLAVDGNYQTWWRQDKTESWLELDLGRDYYLNTLVISWLDVGIGLDFTVFTWDGEEFVEQIKVNGNEDRNSVHYFDQNIKTRRIRLSGFRQKPSHHLIGICEINLLALEPVE